MLVLDGTQELPQEYSVSLDSPRITHRVWPYQPTKDEEWVILCRRLDDMVQVQTLQATRRKEEKGAEGGQLSHPGKQQAGTLADIAEVHTSDCHHRGACLLNALKGLSMTGCEVAPLGPHVRSQTGRLIPAAANAPGQSACTLPCSSKV